MKGRWRCISVESRHTGRKISSIRVCKNKVVLYLSGDKIDISKEAYSSAYLYKGKVLTDNEYSSMKKSIDESTYLTYALKLLGKHYYSSYAMKDKLYKKGANKKVVDKTLKYLIDNKLINDDELAVNYADSMSNSFYGKNRIKEKLKEKKLNYEFIDNYLTYEIELEKCNNYYKFAIKKFASLPNVKRRDSMYRHLVNKGYDVSVVKKVILDQFSYNEKDDLLDLEKALKTALNKARERFENYYDVRKYVFDTLKRKGYKYTDIKKCMEEMEYEFD